MAKAYICEYASVGVARQGNAEIAQDPPLTEQTVAIGGGSTQSSAFNNSTRFIRVHVDSICSIAIGPDPTATTSTKRLVADQTEYFGVIGGHKLAVISNT